MEIYVPVIALVVMIHVLVSALTFIDDDSQHKYHDFAGVQGWVLLVTKVLLWVYFVYTHSKTKKTIERRSQAYFHYLFMLSTAYLLAIPVSILFTFLF